MGTRPVDPALVAEVTRGRSIESRHFGHIAVVDAGGRILYSEGDPAHPIFPRSAWRPLHALAGLAHGVDVAFGLSDAEIAVLCASHNAEPRHRAAVASILERVGATEGDLRCGPHAVEHVPSRDELIRERRKP